MSDIEPNGMKIADCETLIELEGYVLTVEPYIHDDPSYDFVIQEDGRVFVSDPNFGEPVRLSQWVSDLAAFADHEHTPADMTDLTMDIQRRLTTEQGDFTLLMLLSGALRHMPKANRTKRRNSING